MFEFLGANSNWQIHSLGDFLQINGNSWIDIDDSVDYRVLGVTSKGAGLVIKRIISGAELKMRQYQVARLNQLMWCKVDTTNGALGITKPNHVGALSSPNMCLADINSEICLPDFLQLFFRLPAVYDGITTASLGTTNRQYLKPQELLKQVRLHLPPLNEQRRILAHIETIASRVAKAQSLHEDITQSLDAFIGSYNEKYSESRLAKLSEIIYLDEEKETIKPEGSYPQVGVRGFGKGLFARETLTGTQTTYRWFNRLYYGALVLSQVKGWEGAIGVCDSSLVDKYVSPEYRTFRCFPDKALPEYLKALVATPYFYSKLKYLTRGVGGRRERVRPELFLELEIPMPNIERQKKAVEIYSKFSRLRELQFATGEELSALLPSILDKAFKGEL